MADETNNETTAAAGSADDAPARDDDVEFAEQPPGTEPTEIPTAEPPTGDELPDEEPAPQPAGEAPVSEPEADQMPAGEPVAETTATEEAAAADEPPSEEPSGATAEQPPAEEVAASPAEAAAPEGPKRSKKRLPRLARPARTRRVRAAKPAERKPLVRLPKPEAERGARQERRGIVVSAAMDKTIVVKVDTVKAHPRYKKVVRRSQKFHAHDEQNRANVGDVVRIVESRPISKTKSWRLAEVLEEAR